MTWRIPPTERGPTVAEPIKAEPTTVPARNAIALLAEKTIATYVEVFVTLLGAGSVLDSPTTTAASMAAIPAALTVIANGLPEVPAGLTFWLDLVLRVARTYAVTFVGLLVAVPIFRADVSVINAAALAAVPAALAAIKSGLASKIGAPTPALLPAGLDLPVAD